MEAKPEPEAAESATLVALEGVSSVDDIVYSKGEIAKISDMSDNNSGICLSGFDNNIGNCI